MAANKKRRTSNEDDKNTLETIKNAAQAIYDSISKRKAPDMKLPIRSLSNVKYDKKQGFFEIGKSVKKRTLGVNTVKTFAQTLKMMGLSKQLVEADDFATKRDAYYQSKNWGEARFDDQPESDTVMDDIEAMFAIEGVSREQLRFVPDQHGGAVAGSLIVIDYNLETGEKLKSIALVLARALMPCRLGWSI